MTVLVFSPLPRGQRETNRQAAEERKMKYRKMTWGEMEVVINKLGGMEGVEALLRDELIIQPKPLPFPKNENGHYVLKIVGRALTGREEIALLREQGFRVSYYAMQVLNDPEYDANHRLEEGVECNVVLILGREISGNRTTASIREYARGFGYHIPRAGIMSRVRKTVSDRQMEQAEAWYIAGLHDPIKDADGDPIVLHTDRHDGGRWLGAFWGRPDYQWGGSGAFAFLVPAS